MAADACFDAEPEGRWTDDAVVRRNWYGYWAGGGRGVETMEWKLGRVGVARDT